jgi:TonB family protein
MWPCLAVGLGLGVAWVAPLGAQCRLYVLEPDGNYHQVLQADEDQPFIAAEGKLVAAKGRRFALSKVDEYLPAFVAVEDKDVGTSFVMPVGAQPPGLVKINNAFHFRAKFASPFLLENVFLVLECDFEDRGKNIFVYGVGTIEPGVPQTIEVDAPMNRDATTGRCRLHLFVQGVEVFTSEQPAAEREKLLDGMISRRIGSVQQTELKPFYIPAPEYPAALRNSGIRGKALVNLRISPRGAVLESVVANASEPAFGDAALAAVRQWRFLPRIRDGRPVEAQATLPFVFDPPKAAGPAKG